MMNANVDAVGVEIEINGDGVSVVQVRLTPGQPGRVRRVASECLDFRRGQTWVIAFPHKHGYTINFGKYLWSRSHVGVLFMVVIT